MSTKLLAVLFIPLCALAQDLSFQSGVSLSGEVRGAQTGTAEHLFVELYQMGGGATQGREQLDSDGRFHFENVAPGSYRVRVISGPGSSPIYEDALQVGQFGAPLVITLPEQRKDKPISGLISVRQLQHPPSKKAARDFDEAQRYSNSHDTERAIGKLREAIQIDPSFQAAHMNLGVQYARSNRFTEALEEFRTALDIGPPDAKVYANLAWCYARLGQLQDARSNARRALTLDPQNAPAQAILQAVVSH